MGVIGNTIGRVHYVDLPITAGSAPSVSYTAPRALDLVGVEVLARGATAASVSVAAVAVGDAAIAEFEGNFGSAWADAPDGGVPDAAVGGSTGAPQNNQTDVGYANWQSSGAVQGGSRMAGATNTQEITPRDGSVPPPAAETSLATVASGAEVSVAVTGDVEVLEDLPDADATTGFIDLGDGVVQAAPPSGVNTIVGDGYNVPYRVHEDDTVRDTFAGMVRLVFRIPKAGHAEVPPMPWPADPVNGIQRGSGY